MLKMITIIYLFINIYQSTINYYTCYCSYHRINKYKIGKLKNVNSHRISYFLINKIILYFTLIYKIGILYLNRTK